MIISPVTLNEDVFTLVLLGEQMHGDSTFADMDFDRRVAAETMLRVMDNERGLLLKAEHAGHIVGGLMALITPSFFGKDTVASELALYVSPEQRGGSAAFRLVREYVAWAKQQDAKRINAGNSAGMDDERYVSFLSRLGFKRAGSLMFMGA